MVGGGLSTSNFGSKQPLWGEIADFQSIFTPSSSAVRPSENSSVNFNRKSTTHFPVSLGWSLYVFLTPPKGAQKRKTVVFPLKSHFALKIVCN